MSSYDEPEYDLKLPIKKIYDIDKANHYHKNMYNPSLSEDDKKFLQGLTKKISGYSKSGTTKLNEKLWNFKINDKKIPQHDLKKMQHVTNIIDNQKTTHNMYIYTGLNGKYDSQVANGIVHVPSMTSYSLSPGVPVEFSKQKNANKNIIRVRLRNQNQGIYLGDISSYTEKEYLIKPNHVLHIHNTFKTDDGYTVHDAHILNENEIESNKDHPEIQSYLKMKNATGLK